MTPHDLRRSCRIAGALLLAAVMSPAMAQFTLSPSPPLISPPPPTNLVLTIDDSGSMTSAFVPDSVGADPTDTMAAYTSGDFNRLYYNPRITYDIPPNTIDPATGAVSYFAPQTSFTAAYIDGFNPGLGTVNLATSYYATLKSTPGLSSDMRTAPASAPGTIGYYYLFNPASGCTLTPPWVMPVPADTCFTQVVVATATGVPTNSGPALYSSTGKLIKAAGWDETQNFANWFSFYRTRHLAIASAAAIAMKDPGLSQVRLAWQSLNTCNSFLNSTPACLGWDSNATKVDNRLRAFTGSHYTDFYSWLFRVPANGTTPTRLAWQRAGDYFGSSGPDSPYGLDPNNPSGKGPTTELACVNNFQVTMTDGQWNTMNENPLTNFPNEDGASRLLPDHTQYSVATGSASSTSIYSDQNTGGLADIAFHYWATNLRPDLGRAVKPYVTDSSNINPVTGATDWLYWNPRNDPATWPHLVNFTIGVGLTGYLTLPGLNWTTDSFGGTPIPTSLAGVSADNAYANLLSFNTTACTDKANMPNAPVCTWPEISATGSGGNYGNVYDLWHAAINSRGQAFSAESPKDLVSALKQIVNRIEGQANGTSAAAGSTSALTTATTLYVGTYSATDWHGTLLAYSINPPGSNNAGAINATPVWTTDTAGSIPAVAKRHVFTSLASAPLAGNVTTPSGNVFSSSDAALQNSPLWGLLNTPAGGDAANVVDYLLGSAVDETPNGNQYRARPISKLGDLVDSSPVYSYDENFGYQILETAGNPEAKASYITYVTKTKTQSGRPAVVYAGANDGMLHAFDATAGSSTAGTELFAYVPHSVVPNLAALTNPNYAHRFYVDSPSYVGDAFINGAWKTVLVGATGAGGKGVFALDVTSPQNFGAGNVLWDMDGTTTAGGVSGYGNGDPDLGYTIGTPTVVRLNDGNWYAAFGNGYLSTNGCPVLYLVRLDNGRAQTIPALAPPTGATACATPNGLGSPTPLDIDGNGTTDYIYAGDVQGNLWKFDVHASSSTAWGMAPLTGQTAPGRLFAATTGGTLPTPQSIVGAPNLGIGPSGVMVYFSTGHFFATGDASDTSTQSVYAIQDSGNAVNSRATLVAQTYTTDANNTYRTFSANPVNLVNGNDGWVVDFTGGERVTQQPFLVGNVVVFVSELPNGVGNPCTGGCTSFLYGINSLTGAGGMDFFSASGAFYDAIVSGAGCLSGLTVIIENATTVLTYGFGPDLGSNKPSGSTPPAPPGGSTGTPGPTPPASITCPPNMDCNRDKMNNGQGRISWHEMVQ